MTNDGKFENPATSLREKLEYIWKHGDCRDPLRLVKWHIEFVPYLSMGEPKNHKITKSQNLKKQGKTNAKRKQAVIV